MAYSYNTHQQPYGHSMSQSPNSAPVYTPLTTHHSTYDDNTLPYGAPAGGGGGAAPPPPTSDDDQYAIRPSSYFSNPHGNNNNNNHNNTYAASGSAIHLASPPRSAASSYHNSVNGNGNNGGGGGGGGTGGTGGTGSGHATYGTNSNNYRYSSSTPYTKVPLSSPGLSSPSAPTSDPMSPHSAVPLLLNNGGHPSPGLSPPMGGGGGGGGFYSPPPPFTTSLSSPSLQKTQQAALAGAGGGGGGLLSGGGSNAIPVTSSNTSATAHGVSSSASHGLAGGFPGIHGKRKMEQRRYSSFKHSNLDYKNDETLRKAYLSRTEHFISIWLPFLGFCAILGGMWG